jgi:hypothetical protein
VVGEQPAGVAEGAGVRDPGREVVVSAPDTSPVTVKEIAEALGVHPGSVARILARCGITRVGRVPSVRGRRSDVFPPDTIARLVAAGEGRG